MRNRLVPSVFVLLVAIASACASSGSGAASTSAPCELLPQDSVYAMYAPVYRDCAVTTVAKPVTRGITPEFTPQRGVSCYSAEYEFVVLASGEVALNTVRLVKTTDQQFAEAVRSILPRMRYDPATRDGVAVAQIMNFKQSAALVTVVASSPSTARANAARTRPPNC